MLTKQKKSVQVCTNKEETKCVYDRSLYDSYVRTKEICQLNFYWTLSTCHKDPPRKKKKKFRQKISLNAISMNFHRPVSNACENPQTSDVSQIKDLVFVKVSNVLKTMIPLCTKKIILHTYLK